MSQRFPPTAGGSSGPPGTPQRYQSPQPRPYASGPSGGPPFPQQQRGFTPPPMGAGPRPDGPPPGMHQRPQPPFGNMRGSSMPSTPSGKRPQDSRGSINAAPQKSEYTAKKKKKIGRQNFATEST